MLKTQEKFYVTKYSSHEQSMARYIKGSCAYIIEIQIKITWPFVIVHMVQVKPCVISKNPSYFALTNKNHTKCKGCDSRYTHFEAQNSYNLDTFVIT